MVVITAITARSVLQYSQGNARSSRRRSYRSLVYTDATGVVVVQVKSVLGGAHTADLHLDALHPQSVPHLHLVRELGAAERALLLAPAPGLHAEHPVYLLRHPAGVPVHAHPVVAHGRVLALPQVHVVDVSADADPSTLLVVRVVHDLRLVAETVAADSVTDVAVSDPVCRRALRQQRVQQDQQDQYPLVQQYRTEEERESLPAVSKTLPPSAGAV